MGIFTNRKELAEYVKQSKQREAALIGALFKAGYSTAEIAEIANLPAYIVGVRINESLGADASRILLFRETGPNKFVIENPELFLGF